MKEPIKVRFIRMSQELSDGLDYPSKLSREPDAHRRLIADGEAQAAAFLGTFDERAGRWSPSPRRLSSRPSRTRTAGTRLMRRAAIATALLLSALSSRVWRNSRPRPRRRSRRTRWSRSSRSRLPGRRRRRRRPKFRS